MRLYPPELEIGPEEGFSPSKDIFGRKEFGNRLTDIVRSIEGPGVLVLDAPWGAGKTTFVRMWRGELAKAGIPAIHFDAFANDYQEDAFLALAAEVVARVREQSGPKREAALKRFKDGAVSVAKVLSRASIRVGIRVGSAGLLTGEEAEIGAKLAGDIGKAVGDEGSKAADEWLRERLESKAKDESAFKAFGAALEALAANLSDAAALGSEDVAEDGAEPLPLVFIIDELDRCRPPFALALLERIKHFFAVPGVVFVLVTNVAQLESSVEYAYGSKLDARTYLEKFYHLRIGLPHAVPVRDRSSASQEYVRHLFKEFMPRFNDRDFLQAMQEDVSFLADTHGLSLRTVERILGYVALATVSINERTLRIAPLIAGLSFLKVRRPDLFSRVAARKASYEEVGPALAFTARLEPGSETMDRSDGWWRYALGSLDKEQRERYQQRLFEYSIAHHGLLPFFASLLEAASFPGAPIKATR